MLNLPMRSILAAYRKVFKRRRTPQASGSKSQQMERCIPSIPRTQLQPSAAPVTYIHGGISLWRTSGRPWIPYCHVRTSFLRPFQNSRHRQPRSGCSLQPRALWIQVINQLTRLTQDNVINKIMTFNRSSFRIAGRQLSVQPTKSHNNENVPQDCHFLTCS